ncbi:porin family protein [Flavobacterium muglaense]|uniref:Outer membrane beta-barrel protein n=1 Tax=Flavobacterium muglaense TaxID=2764716 RepID=A0A923N4W3_9FLAO|nr:outer membrane beta-barrel protein [Flavobacterium muglaense]MBC5839540.1 outer membrane beta-barrel protein [Flavobacterium muglaense]MBC5846065.1 outer membrane beta-barrel protein [Flavobacterium muglaense]
MRFNVKNIIGITAFLISQGMIAQFYIGAQSGIGNIQSDVKGTTAGNRLGGAVKVGYIYSLTDHIGIGSGVEFAQYKQQVYLSNSSVTLSRFEVDAATSAFVYNVTTSNYKEEQTLHAVQIPLFVQYSTNINKGVGFNFRAGAKYFLPVNYKIEATANSVNGSAYYPDVNLNITDLPEYGFGGQRNYSASGEYQTKGIVMSMFELGFTFDIGKKNALYAAMFLEKGYGSILNQDQDKSYLGYNPTSAENRKANGLYSTDKNAKIQPVAFGLTLGWNFK